MQHELMSVLLMIAGDGETKDPTEDVAESEDAAS